jgi:hypothetical protein
MIFNERVLTFLLENSCSREFLARYIECTTEYSPGHLVAWSRRKLADVYDRCMAIPCLRVFLQCLEESPATFTPDAVSRSFP